MEQTRQAFARIVAPGHGRLDGNLDQAALLIAQAIDTSIVIEDELGRLDALAEQAGATTAAELALALFGGAGHDPARHFGGNNDAYYDRENSLLNRVLDRRVGIPITLSVLFIEVGRRAGIALHGVGMPGHFLTGSAHGYVDVFNGGVMLDKAGCQRLFRRFGGPDAMLPDQALAATPPALIAKRMLFNLSGIGSSQQERRTLRAARSLLAAYPDADHRDHVQHAYAAAEIGQFGEAAYAAERALVTIPEQVRDKLAAQVDAWRARLN